MKLSVFCDDYLQWKEKRKKDTESMNEMIICEEFLYNTKQIMKPMESDKLLKHSMNCGS